MSSSGEASSKKRRRDLVPDPAQELPQLQHAQSVAGRTLPPPSTPHDHNKTTGTLLLFYQYKEEPLWTKVEHRRVLKHVLKLAQEHEITGRGRIAPEGLNCTLTGSPSNVRQFCQALRQYDTLFEQTDFKLTDGLPQDQLFKSLSIRKTEELVAYGMAGEDKAPRLDKFQGQHLDADRFHEAMCQENTVVVDVRNAYETELGHFQPPPGGAQLLDPKLRNSIEFPKWLASAETQKQLHGKTVLMYCTGGIRCERATALVNQMASVAKKQQTEQDTRTDSSSSSGSTPAFQPAGVYELQGGIERYLKTYPKGGLWKGKNYLFDRRREQVPEQRNVAEVEAEMTRSKCVVCRQQVCTSYRGKFQCASALCGVPVLVCQACSVAATQHPQQLQCPLCQQGYKTPQLRNTPEFLEDLKRKAEEIDQDGKQEDEKHRTKTPNKKAKVDNDGKQLQQELVAIPDRLFLSKLPLTVTKTRLQQDVLSLPPSSHIIQLHWLTDRRTGAFYGSCVVQLSSAESAQAALEQHKAAPTTETKFSSRKRKRRRRVRVVYCRRDPSQEDVWPPAHGRHCGGEYPPLGKVT